MDNIFDISVEEINRRMEIRSIIKDEIKQILKTIKDDIIKAAHQDLAPYCVYTPPLHFDVPDKLNKKASLIIYTSVIQQIESKGFKVTIDKNTKQWTIQGWGTIDDVKMGNESKLLAYFKNHIV